MKLLARVVPVFVACLFVAFAALQYNDPDAAMWMSIYLAAAAYCGVAGFRLPPAWLSRALAAGAILAAVAIWPAEWTGLLDGDDTSQAAENARETMGLLIIAAAMALVALASRWRSALAS